MITELRKMLGQMIITGFCGLNACSDSGIGKTIRHLQVGGVILFDWDGHRREYGRNISSPGQLKRLIKECQKYSSIPLFIAIDQEGGKVCRLKKEKGFAGFQGAGSIGNIDDHDEIVKWSEGIASEIFELGINLDLAPVVDLKIEPESPVIAELERSFGLDPYKVSRIAGIFCKALRKYNVLCCLKHFPGHGSAKKDTHMEFTDISNTWNENELIPYRRLIAQDLPDLIMTGHLFNEKLDAMYPASLSSQTITGFLRDKLNWQGLVISDDLQMKAITDNYSIEEAAFLAVKAGTDLLLLGNNSQFDPYETVETVISALERRVHSKELSEERIFQSWRRIMRIKMRELN